MVHLIFDQLNDLDPHLQYTYVQCNHCSLVYSSPRPKYDTDFIEAAYGQYYQFDDNLQLNENTQITTIVSRFVYKRITEHHSIR